MKEELQATEAARNLTEGLCPNCLEVVCECATQTAKAAAQAAEAEAPKTTRRRASPKAHQANASAQDHVDEIAQLDGGHVLLRKAGSPKAKKSTYAVAGPVSAKGRTVLTSWTTKKQALAEWSAKQEGGLP